jgi:ribosomal protein S6
MESEIRNYELGYHVTTNVAEGRQETIKSELEKLVTDAGGSITFSQTPELKKLSYQIDHQRQAFFGWMQFSLPHADEEAEETVDVLAALDEQLRLNNELLRYVVLRLEPEEDKRTAPLAASRERKAAAEAAQPRKVDEKKAEDSGKLESELEDVLENL